MKSSLFMRREPDPNPNGYTRFRDFCIGCGKGIRVGERVGRTEMPDGETDYTCEHCLNQELIAALGRLNDVAEELLTTLSSAK